jgi:ABC-type bacteriocin/lantibiotic exporter with double-glycine peptidase domain
MLLGVWSMIATSASAARLTVPFFPDKSDQCGPATLASVLSFWGKPTTPTRLRQELYLAKLHGTLPMDLLLTAQAHGLKADMVAGNLDTLRAEVGAGRPVIAMLNRGFEIAPINHYVVVTGFDETRQGLFVHSGGTKNQFIPYAAFLRQWKKTDYWTLLARPAS